MTPFSGHRRCGHYIRNPEIKSPYTIFSGDDHTFYSYIYLVIGTPGLDKDEFLIWKSDKMKTLRLLLSVMYLTGLNISARSNERLRINREG